MSTIFHCTGEQKIRAESTERFVQGGVHLAWIKITLCSLICTLKRNNFYEYLVSRFPLCQSETIPVSR